MSAPAPQNIVELLLRVGEDGLELITEIVVEVEDAVVG
jgi:hypothetical protein